MVEYSVQTDLDPQALTQVAIDTFKIWLAFALGQSDLGGKTRTLMHPSGKYASSISWRKTGESEVAIIADESVAPEANWIESGRSAFSIKAAMLGKGKTKISKAGYRYRFIPFTANAPTPKFNMSSIITNSKGGRLPIRSVKMWAKASANRGYKGGAVMTDKPGSSTWISPPMPAYSPAKILSDMIREGYGVK